MHASLACSCTCAGPLQAQGPSTARHASWQLAGRAASAGWLWWVRQARLTPQLRLAGTLATSAACSSPTACSAWAAQPLCSPTSSGTAGAPSEGPVFQQAPLAHSIKAACTLPRLRPGQQGRESSPPGCSRPGSTQQQTLQPPRARACPHMLASGGARRSSRPAVKSRLLWPSRNAMPGGAPLHPVCAPGAGAGGCCAQVPAAARGAHAHGGQRQQLRLRVPAGGRRRRGALAACTNLHAELHTARTAWLPILACPVAAHGLAGQLQPVLHPVAGDVSQPTGCKAALRPQHAHTQLPVLGRWACCSASS